MLLQAVGFKFSNKINLNIDKHYRMKPHRGQKTSEVCADTCWLVAWLTVCSALVIVLVYLPLGYINVRIIYFICSMYLREEQNQGQQWCIASNALPIIAEE